MIRNLIFLLAASLCSADASAQKQQTPGNQTVNKTTAIASRMIASNHAHVTGTSGNRDDSTRMYYASVYRGRSAALRFSELMWDITTWQYDSAAAYVPYSLLVKYNNTYDANARLILSTEYYLTGTPPAGPYTKNMEYTYAYGPNGKMQSRLKAYFNSFTTWDTSRITVTYNTADFVDTINEETWNVGSQTWGLQKRSTFIYNTSNKLTNKKEIFPALNRIWSTDYTYDVSGNLTKEETMIYQGANPAYLGKSKTHTYTGADITATVTEVFNGTSLVNDKRNVYTYNSYHQVLNDTMYNWNSGNSTFELNNSNVFNYYYEDYTDTTTTPTPGNVNNVQGSNTAFSIYPVPAGNTVHITTDFAIAQNTVLAIYDIAGRMAMQKTLPSSGKLNEQLDISTLPAGNYTVQLNTPAINWVQKLTVLK